MKDIEKYVWYYISIYIFVLGIFAFFQYIAICNGESLNCKVYWSDVKDILQTTAYIVTPVVAIVAFVSWKDQHNKRVYSDFSIALLKRYEKIFLSFTKITSLNEMLDTFDNYPFKNDNERYQNLMFIFKNFMDHRKIIETEVNDLLLETSFFTIVAKDSELLRMIMDFKVQVTSVLMTDNDSILRNPNLNEDQLRSYIMKHDEGFKMLLSTFNIALIDKFRDYIKA